MEALLWRNGNRYCLAVIKNLLPSGDGAASAALLGKDADRNPNESLFESIYRSRASETVGPEKFLAM